jgi:hypothetical protein
MGGGLESRCVGGADGAVRVQSHGTIRTSLACIVLIVLRVLL